MNVVTRIAPSPTNSYLHLGNLRTLLFNYFLAKKHGGKFLVRLEDTDRDRYTPSFLEYFKETMDWLGIVPDSSYWNPDKSIGSFIQSERDYSDKIKFLLDNDFAYISFDTPEEINEKKKIDPQFKYDYDSRMYLKNSLSLIKSETESLISNGVPHVIRFKVPKNMDISFIDEILGEITINSSQLDDKVLIKSNGIGSYHLCNVCDDHDMGVTHVLRGQEWVNSTPFHILLYKAFGWDLPKFAHLPLIMNPDGKGKLSKRTASRYGIPIAPIGYTNDMGKFQKGWREEGFEPDALINSLSLIGWNPGDEKELMDIDEIISKFSLDRVHKSGARFDMNKAKWINSHKINDIPNKDLWKDILIKDDRFSKDKIDMIISEAKIRSDFRKDLQDTVNIFFEDRDSMLRPSPELELALSYIDDWDSDNILDKIDSICKERNIQKGKVLKSLRDCLVNGHKGPDLKTTIEILGKKIVKSKLMSFAGSV